MLGRGAPQERTSEDGNDGFMDGRYLPLLHRIAGEEGHNKQHDGDEKGP